MYNSSETPVRSEGGIGTQTPRARGVQVRGSDGRHRWIESALYQDGYVFAWYHAEDFVECPGRSLAVPSIGAMMSTDGIHFDDLGIIIDAPGEPSCSEGNIYFAGGHGDFTVVPDRNREYVYFFYTNYSGPVEAQGIAVARMGFEDRWSPTGRVWKFRAGEWNEPGLGGSADPVFPAQQSWTSERPLSYWGPSVHWNTALKQYVMLMSEAIDRQWNQGGIYISYAADLANPTSWMPARQLLWTEGWYPQVVGTGPGESGQIGGHHHGGGVLAVQIAVARVGAELFEDRSQALFRHRAIAQAIARALQAHDEAVANKLVFAHAFDVGDVLDARGRFSGGGDGRREQQDRHKIFHVVFHAGLRRLIARTCARAKSRPRALCEKCHGGVALGFFGRVGRSAKPAESAAKTAGR